MMIGDWLGMAPIQSQIDRLPYVPSAVWPFSLVVALIRALSAFSLAIYTANMVPQLDFLQRNQIKSMLKLGYTNRIIASDASCSIRAVQRIRLKREASDTLTTIRARVGRRSSITPTMRKALRYILTERPDMYRDELIDFINKNFGKRVSERAIGQSLRSMGWSRTTIRCIAQQRDDDLRDFYLHTISNFESYHFVFVNESGCDRKAGYCRWGWSPKGTSPVQITRFGRGKRWHILPAYAQDGIVLRRVYQGLTNSSLFEDFIAQLLHHCGRYPEPKSVIVMNNASWHHSEKIIEMCRAVGVIVAFLSPYSPDFNPIEEHFGVLKRFIKKHWRENKDFIRREFKMYLEWCVDVVGTT
jgi:transposase